MFGHGGIGDLPLGGEVDLRPVFAGTDGSRYTRRRERDKFNARIRAARRRKEEEQRVAAEKRAEIARKAEERRQAQLSAAMDMLEQYVTAERDRRARDDEEAALMLLLS